MKETKFKISELAEKAEVSKRTIHYYIARRLLPPPEGSGLGTLYSEEHLYRIRLIRKWQSQFLPLEEIRTRLLPLSLEEVKQLWNDSMYIPVLPMPVVQERSSVGKHYRRIQLEEGLEIHYCEENLSASKKAEEMMLWFLHQKKEG